MMPFSEIEEELTELLHLYDPSASSAAEPFWRLQSDDDLWVLEGEGLKPLRASGGAPTAAALRSHHVRGGLSKPYYDALIKDDVLIADAVDTVATTFFPEEFHKGIYDQFGFSPKELSQTGPVKVVAEPSDWQQRIPTATKAGMQRGKPAEYHEFWQSLLERARAAYPTLPWRRTPPHRSWLELRSPIPGTVICFTFSSRGIRVELYIDSGVAEENQRLFGILEQNRELLEGEVGSELEWDKLPARRACRISAYMPGGGVVSEENRRPQFITWFLATGSKWMTAATRIAPQLRVQ